ncbi:MAG: efflux RND transporter periplasmic adaptor subunit [Gammaproteobacteria bacterium]|nr:efflux RND transporter periplasmic adaptor subunit [Gammaproteobacteria bacterium]
MTRFRLKFLLPIGIVVVALVAGRAIIGSKPQAERSAPLVVPLSVEATRLVSTDYQVMVTADGTVRPRTSSTLIPQVPGRVIEVSPSFREGGFFERGDVLMRLEPRDFELALSSAEAQVAQASAAMEQELALAEVVKHDWESLGKQAPDLGLRKPQIAAARASLQSAEAQLERAQVDLQRTVIRAPYAGRILEQNVDIGQFVSVGTTLAKIYAVDYVEIRLPLSNRQLEYVRLPERFRNDGNVTSQDGPAVTIEAVVGRTAYTWEGRIVRAEGTIDTQSRQLYVVAQVDAPYARGPEGRPPLRIGQFVQARIYGSLLKNVIVIPRSALREGGEVLLVDEDSVLRRRAVSVLWSDETQVVLGDSLAPGEILALTPLSISADGSPVTATVDGAVMKGRGAKPPGSQPALDAVSTE